MNNIIYIVLQVWLVASKKPYMEDEDASFTKVYDLSKPTNWKEMNDYYGAIEKHWKICINCGIPGLGTGLHLEHLGIKGSMQPAMIPTEYLITRLAVIDVSYLTKVNSDFALSLDVALQWSVLKYDPQEPTLVLFKFGWTSSNHFKRTCVCKIPGLSYELADWIAANLSHVVGIATDAPSLESDQTRELTVHTVSNVLGKSGVYMIENVYIKGKIPERGCLTITMPLMMTGATYVPTRITAFCPAQKTNYQVSLALTKRVSNKKELNGRVNQLNLNEILN